MPGRPLRGAGLRRGEDVLAGGDELAGKLEQVGGNIDGRASVLKDGRLAKGDLLIEREGFGFIERVVRESEFQWGA